MYVLLVFLDIFSNYLLVVSIIIASKVCNKNTGFIMSTSENSNDDMFVSLFAPPSMKIVP